MLADYDGLAERAELRAQDKAQIGSAVLIERMTVEDRRFRSANRRFFGKKNRPWPRDSSASLRESPRLISG
jgi:hypothetical protein